MAAAAALALADASIVTLALPRLIPELDASVEGAAAVIGVYTVVLAVALLPARSLRRRLGARRFGAGSLALFAAACAGCAAAGSLELLLVLRGLQAIGGAGALLAAFELLGAGEEGSPGRRLWNEAAVLGVAAGPAIGGVLTQAFDWRAIFVAQIPVAVAGAVAVARAGEAAEEAEPPAASTPLRPGQGRALAALGVVSAALTAVLFILVLLLVVGWNLSPIQAALAVSVLPLAAIGGGRLRGRGDPRARAATGCALVGAGTLALAFLPLPSAWWTVVPQLLAGLGMGLAIPAFAGELIPERSQADAARLLSARSFGIAIALFLLAPVISSGLDSATERARERGVAIVLDSPLPPQSKIKLAPELLSGVAAEQPRHELARALARNRSHFSGAERADYDQLAKRADETLVQAVREAFRAAFLISGALGLVAALLVLPAPERRPQFARAAALAVTVPLLYVVLEATLAPEPVTIGDPCSARSTPGGSGIGGVLQDQVLATLDQVACHFGSSREELVLALADERDAKLYKEHHGVDPRSAGDLLQGLIGP